MHCGVQVEMRVPVWDLSQSDSSGHSSVHLFFSPSTSWFAFQSFSVIRPAHSNTSMNVDVKQDAGSRKQEGMESEMSPK